MTKEQLSRVRDLSSAVKGTQMDVQEDEGYLLEFQWREDEVCAYLTGNNAGLLHFARMLIDLCSKESETAHLHLDKHSNFDENSNAMLVARSFDNAT